MHPLQVSEHIPKRRTGTGAIGISTTYSRDDHQHLLNTDPTVVNKQMKDIRSGDKVSASAVLNGTQAGTGTTNRASNGSVQYSSGNPILWRVNSVGAEGWFYGNGTNICWISGPITLGSIHP
ncbi:MAG: hypothetical protein EZS28_007121 [Streblomastix strix]|uniref:Uncharacterized protein n=1 Tax=Streblomastix strix TaxID=222440 RepID=A0A5J4WTA5_9EUKA|nr:MAG: hypothetical protein EZS28_007121 [Streblomastix strix]